MPILDKPNVDCHMKQVINRLELVYYPLSSQELQWLWKDAEFLNEVSPSKLYMIVQRSEIFMENFGISEDGLSLDLVHDGTVQRITIPLTQFHAVPAELDIELGPKIFKVWHMDNGIEPLYVATVDRLLLEFARKKLIIKGLTEHRKLSTFLLHYIGISKSNNSVQRLAGGHENWLKILINEHQLTPTSRNADEILLLLFDIKPFVTVMKRDNLKLDGGLQTDRSKTIADAEKAFVYIMKSKYNTIEFNQYPISKDGLANEGLDRYGYVIDESICLKTDTQVINGLESSEIQSGNIGDLIVVEGQKVSLVKNYSTS